MAWATSGQPLAPEQKCCCDPWHLLRGASEAGYYGHQAFLL